MKVLISCGEPSGDLYAGALAREIRSLDPSARIFGLGGERTPRRRGNAQRRLSRVDPPLDCPRLSRCCPGHLPPTADSCSWPAPSAQMFSCRSIFRSSTSDLPPRSRKWASRSSTTSVPRCGPGGRGRFRSIKRSTDRALVIFPFEEAILSTGWSPGRVRWAPSAGALRVRAPQSGVSSGHPARSICADCRAAARQPAERGAGDPTRPSPRGTARASEGLRRPVHRGPRAASRGPSVRAACRPDERGTAGGHRGGSNRRCAGGIRCRRHGVRDRDGPNRHPRTPHGDRVPAVAADLSAGAGLCPRRYRGDGEPHRRSYGRTGAHPGRLHAPGRCRRGGELHPGPRPCRPDASSARGSAGRSWARRVPAAVRPR